MRTQCLAVAAIGLLAGAQVGLGQEIRLRYAEFDPIVALPGVPAELRAPAGSELRIIQFDAPPSESVTAGARALGVTIHRVLHERAVIASVPAGLDVEGLEYVRWCGAFHPAYKLDASLLSRIVAGAGGESHWVSIELFERGMDSRLRVAEVIRSVGGEVLLTTAGGLRMEASLDLEQLLGVARLDEVHFIDPQGEMGADMDIVTRFVGAPFLRSTFGIEGTGVRGEVFDTGLDVNSALWRHEPIVHSSSAMGTTHGGFVYSIAFADDAALPGLLPDGQGVFYQYQESSWFGGTKPFAEILSEAIDPGGPYRVDFFTSSVGGPRTTQYTTVSAETDDALLRNPVLATWTTGNTNGPDFRPQAWAKNVVPVGGARHFETLTPLDDTAGVTSSGPAADGRISPYFMLFDDGIDTPLGTFGGASATAPAVAACFGLLHQMWHEGLFPGFGGGASVFDDRPHPATARAVMATGAFRYDWTAGGPNGSITRFVQGWGVPDLENLAALAPKTFVVDASEALEHGESRAYDVLVRPGEPALAVSMSFLDPAGTVSASQHRINNLSLRVMSPLGTTYWGNEGLVDSNRSVPAIGGGNEDDLNTFENVFVEGPESGVWRIEVIATEVLEDARLTTPEIDADFGLAAAGVALCPADCDTGSGVNVLDIFDFLCFQDAFVTSEGYADCDGSGGLDVFDFLCFQDAFVSGCP